MNGVGKKIAEARRKQNLSLKELSERTKIRVHIIEAIESENYSVMPEVYMNSFLKTLAGVLKIDLFAQEPKPEIKLPKSETPKPILEEKESSVPQSSPSKPPINKEIKDFAEIFKKKNVQKRDKRAIYNYTLITALVIFVGLAIYFTISSIYGSGKGPSDSQFISGADTAVIAEEKSGSLFSYFEKTDSLVLTAKAKDSAWVRLLIDGKQIIEILMRPGNEERWSATKYFVLDQGNAGAIQFYRNNELLPTFGKPGTVVKNIKITMTEIINPLQFKDTSLNQRANRKKAADSSNKKPKLIEESKIETDKNIFNREESNESQQ